MNCDKEINLTHSKFIAQWWAIIALFSIALTFTACEKDCACDEDGVDEYPSLKVVNQNSSKRIITSVSLVGYVFTNLSIEVGDSQTFTLEEGMPGGYSDIHISVSYKYGGYPTASRSINVDFSDGETTTITLKGCTGAEGCDGLYLE